MSFFIYKKYGPGDARGMEFVMMNGRIMIRRNVFKHLEMTFKKIKTSNCTYSLKIQTDNFETESCICNDMRLSIFVFIAKLPDVLPAKRLKDFPHDCMREVMILVKVAAGGENLNLEGLVKAR